MRKKRLNEINVTPFVDVCLVLLVVLMVVAPIANKAIEMQLPSGKNANASANKEMLNINIDKNGNIYILSQHIKSKNLYKKLDAISGIKKDKLNILISADKDVHYKHVIEVLDVVQALGIGSFALEIENEK